MLVVFVINLQTNYLYPIKSPEVLIGVKLVKNNNNKQTSKRTNLFIPVLFWINVRSTPNIHL